MANEKEYTVSSLTPRIEGFLQPVCRRARFQVGFRVEPGENAHPDFENPDVVVKFSGEDVDLLLANKAELLLALEHLTMEALGIPPEDHSRLCFDANDYRALRIEELRLSAMTAAEKVRKTRVPFHFNPMTSRERRIIHLALRNESGVRSESTGVGPVRQVVIVPADMMTLPPPKIVPTKPHGDGRPPRRGHRR